MLIVMDTKVTNTDLLQSPIATGAKRPSHHYNDLFFARAKPIVIDKG